MFNGGSATLSSRTRPDVNWVLRNRIYTGAGSVGGKMMALLIKNGCCLHNTFFSKRTLCYLVGAYQTASGVNSIGQGGSRRKLSWLTPSATNKQLVTRAGFRHNF